jgi:hypothetical protein
MNSIRQIQKYAKASVIMLLLAFSIPASARRNTPPQTPASEQNIMLAILLDTSNSMDGLIDQAKSQLWKIVNDLALAKCDDGARPKIRIALYEYGNDNLPSSEGYIRMVSSLTDDLDVISEKLFALKTHGGNEFCGQVIQTSLNQLAWSVSKSDLKMIFIAGNEPFTQGTVSYNSACALAKDKDVVVNTIFCGNFEEGLQTGWKSGADLAGGSYMSIAQDRKTVYVPTPYDDRIAELNDRLNTTYIYYGQSGYAKMENQKTQDRNAERYSKANKVERAVSKSSYVYENSSWDLVDASKESDKVIREAKDDELPKEMRGMTVEQRKTYVKTKEGERKKIQEEIGTLNKQRQAYISAHQSNAQDTSLDGAMLKSIRTKGKTKNLSWQ